MSRTQPQNNRRTQTCSGVVVYLELTIFRRAPTAEKRAHMRTRVRNDAYYPNELCARVSGVADEHSL